MGLAGQIEDKWNGGAERGPSIDRSVPPMACHANGLTAHLELGRVFRISQTSQHRVKYEGRIVKSWRTRLWLCKQLDEMKQ
jgi:hypothetical protein